MGVGNFSIDDLHGWNISRERFLELIVKCNYKVDEAKIDGLLSGALENTRIIADFTIQYAKIETLSPDQVKEVMIKEKEFSDKLLSIGILEAHRINITKEASKIQQNEEKFKEAIIEFLNYLHKKSEEAKKIINEQYYTQQIEKQNREQMEKIMKEYIAWANQRNRDLLNEINLLDGQIKGLEALHQEHLQFYAQLVMSELEEIKDENGNSIFQGMNPEQKLETTKEIILAYHKEERWLGKQIEKELNEIQQLEDRIALLKQEIAIKRAETSFASNSSRKTISPNFNSRMTNGLGKLNQELAELEAQVDQRKANLPNKKIELNAQKNERFENRITNICGDHHIPTSAVPNIIQHVQQNDKFKAAHSAMNPLRDMRKKAIVKMRGLNGELKENLGFLGRIKQNIDVARKDLKEKIVNKEEKKVDELTKIRTERKELKQKHNEITNVLQVETQVKKEITHFQVQANMTQEKVDLKEEKIAHKEEKIAHKEEEIAHKEEVNQETEELSTENNENDELLRMILELSDEVDTDLMEEANQQVSEHHDFKGEIDEEPDLSEKESKHIHVSRP